jgi:hypothetical protein
MGPRDVEAVGHVVTARYDAVDVIAAAAASTPARPKGASAPETKNVAIGAPGVVRGGEVPIAIFLRFGIRLAAFLHGGFLSSFPPPRQRGRGTTLRSRVVEGAQAAKKL